jgi:hypothetical protein
MVMRATNRNSDASDRDTAELLLADCGLFHLDADLRWLDLTSTRLGALAETVGVA